MNQKTKLTLKIFAKQKAEEIGYALIIILAFTAICFWAFFHFDLLWNLDLMSSIPDCSENSYGECWMNKSLAASLLTMAILFGEYCIIDWLLSNWRKAKSKAEKELNKRKEKKK